MAGPASTAGTLVRGSIFRNLDLLVLLSVTFVITPFVVRSLGDRMYGFWTLLGTLMGYYGLLDFGLSSAAARYISQSLGKGDTEELNAVANTSFFLFSVIGAAAMLAAVASAAAAPLFLGDPAEIALFRRLILIMGAATAIGFPFRVFQGVLISYIRYDSLAVLNIARTLLTNAGIYWCLSTGGGITSVAIITLVVSVLHNAGMFAVCRLQMPSVRIVFFRWRGETVRSMFDYSWKTFVCQLGDILRFQFDSLLIAAFLSVSMITPYFIGARLVSGFGQLVTSSVGVMLPVFSQYEGRGDYDSIRTALLKVTTLSTVLSAFVGMSVMFYSRAFILRWMGPGFESSHIIVNILCVGAIMGLAEYPGVQLLYGLSRHNYLAVMNTCQAVLNVFLSVVFLKYFSLYGVALGSTVETLLYTLLILPIYVCRFAQLPVRRYLWDALLAPLLKTAIPLGAYFYFARGFVRPDYSTLLACVALQALLFAPLAYFFIVGEDERRFIRRAVGLGPTRRERFGFGGELDDSAGL